MDGFRATAVCPVGGPQAAEKARRTAKSIIERCVEEKMLSVCVYSDFLSSLIINGVFVCRTSRMFKQLGLDSFSSVNIQVLGAEDTYGANAHTKVKHLLYVLVRLVLF